MAASTAALSPRSKRKARLPGRFVPQSRRAIAKRRGRVDHRRQHAVVDRDELGGVARELARFGDDERDRVADMAHPLGGEREARRHDQRVDRRDLRDARQRADPVGGEIGGGEDAVNPGQRICRRRVDTGDLGMAVRRADDDGMELAENVDVVDKATLAAQEPVVLEPGQRAADLSVRHRLIRRRLAPPPRDGVGSKAAASPVSQALRRPNRAPTTPRR